MPVSDWPSDVPPGRPPKQQYDAIRAKQGEALSLLADLHAATQGFSDALVRAGFPASAWRSGSAVLADLSDQLPEITLDTLLTRISEFAAGTGPEWLMGDDDALDDFEHEVRMLTPLARALRTVAQRQRLKPSAERGPHPLNRAMGDAGVGIQIDRLARSLRWLEDVAPQLVPLPPEPEPAPEPAAPPVPPARQEDPRAEAAPPVSGPPQAREELPTQPLAEPGMRTESEAGASARVLPFISMLGARASQLRQSNAFVRLLWPRDRRMWVVGLVGMLLIGTLSGVLAFASHQPPAAPSGSTAQRVTQGLAPTATALPRPTPTITPYHQIVPPSVPATPMATATASPAHLTVSPTSIVLACSGISVTLTLSDTGAQPLAWKAAAASNEILSATSGSLDAHSSGTITVHASGPRHGPSTITFTSDGGTVTVTDKVSCR